MVSCTFQFAEHADQVHPRMYRFRMFGNIVRNDTCCPGIDLIQQIIFGKDTCRQFNTLLIQGTFRQFQHGQHLGLHLRQPKTVQQFCIQHRFFTTNHKAGNPFRKVSQAFQIRIDFQHSQHKTQVDRHRII